MRARTIAQIAVFVALSVASGLALVAVPNVELITLSVFCAGMFLGARSGAVVGLLAMFLFTVFNPYGLAAVPIAAAQMGMMAITGMAGGWERPWLDSTVGRSGAGRSVAGLIALAATGVVLTVAYDVVVSAAYAATLAGSLAGFWALVVAGSVFSLLHVVTNGLIFCVIGGSAVRVLSHWRQARGAAP